MKLLVLGAGAIGGYFGGRLAEAGVDVTFLVRPRRREQLSRDGLRIASPRGDLALRVQTVLAPDLKPDYDVVLLTCKSYDLDAALESIAPAVRGGAAVLPLLNGMAHLDQIAGWFGPSAVLGGTCSVSVVLQPDGTIRHKTPLQSIAFGERDKSKSARVSAIADAFAKTKLDWELADDIIQNMWEKIAFLSVLASANCLFRANIGEVLQAPGGPESIVQGLSANFELASREGHALRQPAVEFALKALTTPGSPLSGSMLHDVESGAPTEADHIIGWMLEAMRHHEIESPLLAMAYTSLKAYEARRLAKRLPVSADPGIPSAGRRA
jgi:2-dehydropantoate 2-reductase